jgi:hypothetical protein
MTAGPWKAVASKKPLRKGEAFILRNDVFVLKVYRDTAPDTKKFAEWLADQLNQSEQRRDQKTNDTIGEGARGPEGKPVEPDAELQRETGGAEVRGSSEGEEYYISERDDDIGVPECCNYCGAIPARDGVEHFPSCTRPPNLDDAQPRNVWSVGEHHDQQPAIPDRRIDGDGGDTANRPRRVRSARSGARRPRVRRVAVEPEGQGVRPAPIRADQHPALRHGQRPTVAHPQEATCTTPKNVCSQGPAHS